MRWQKTIPSLVTVVKQQAAQNSYNAFASDPEHFGITQRFFFSPKDDTNSSDQTYLQFLPRLKKINKSMLTGILEYTDPTVKFQHYEINSRKQ